MVFDDTCVLCGRLPKETISRTWAARAATLQRGRNGGPSLGRLRPAVSKAVGTPRRVQYEPDLGDLTPAQRAYLDSFDEHLQTGGRASRVRMSQRLEAVLNESGVKPSGRSHIGPAQPRRSTIRKRNMILSLLRERPDLSRAEIAMALPDGRGLSTLLPKMQRDGVIFMDEMADPPTYAIVALGSPLPVAA